MSFESFAYVTHKLSHSLRDTAYTFGLNDGNGKTPQARNFPRAMALAYPVSVFVIVPIDNVMTTVFDAPVATVGGKLSLILDCTIHSIHHADKFSQQIIACGVYQMPTEFLNKI